MRGIQRPAFAAIGQPIIAAGAGILGAVVSQVFNPPLDYLFKKFNVPPDPDIRLAITEAYILNQENQAPHGFTKVSWQQQQPWSGIVEE